MQDIAGEKKKTTSQTTFSYGLLHMSTRRCSCGVMVKEMDCGIVVSEFEPQSRYYVHFRTNTLGKVMNPLFLPAMG